MGCCAAGYLPRALLLGRVGVVGVTFDYTRAMAAFAKVRAAVGNLDTVLAECPNWDRDYDERFVHEWREFISTMNDLECTVSLALSGRKPSWEDMYYDN